MKSLRWQIYSFTSGISNMKFTDRVQCIKGFTLQLLYQSAELLEQKLANSCMTMLRYEQFPMILCSGY